tara:strand:- start:47597 stop:48022 length:426 start_codon:yes stop_codon:yes gene_type:complete
MWTYFFYGTLRDPEIARIILGRPLSGLAPTAAKLRGYRAVCVAGASYPGLVAAPDDVDASVIGIVVSRLSGLDVSRLDRYEGPEYATEDVVVQTSDGATVEARVYLPCAALQLADKTWSLTDWQRQDKKRFIGGLRRKALL